MNDKELIARTADFIRDKFESENTGHDWWHMKRVWDLSKTIGKKEHGANMLVVELAALLHDIADWKFHEDPKAGSKAAKAWLNSIKVDPDVTKQVCYIVDHVSFKGGTNQHKMQTLEGQIVQDADRLDGLGAIGIARTFAFGGAAGREIYNPNLKPLSYKSLEDFKQKIKTNHTINHFYEKLLLLKEYMNTQTAKEMAEDRHKFMEKFLDEFYDEWEGKK